MRLKRFRKTAFCQKYCSPLKAGAMRLKSVKKKRRLIGAVQRIRLHVKSALLTLCLAYIHWGPICQSNYGRRSRRPFTRALRALEKSLKSSRMALPSPAAQTHCACRNGKDPAEKEWQRRRLLLDLRYRSVSVLSRTHPKTLIRPKTVQIFGMARSAGRKSEAAMIKFRNKETIYGPSRVRYAQSRQPA